MPGPWGTPGQTPHYPQPGHLTRYLTLYYVRTFPFSRLRFFPALNQLFRLMLEISLLQRRSSLFKLDTLRAFRPSLFCNIRRPRSSYSPLIRSQFLYQTTRSAMNIAPEKREWLCIIPDKPGMLEKRLEIRPYAIHYLLT